MTITHTVDSDIRRMLAEAEADEKRRASRRARNGHARPEPPPREEPGDPGASPDAYGVTQSAEGLKEPFDKSPSRDVSETPLSEAEWEARVLALPDPLLGDWFTTTSRVLMTAPTGTGKSMVAIAAGRSMSAGMPFLRWNGRRESQILYIDGEMSRRLLKQRLADEKERSGFSAPGFFALSREDISSFDPLSTAAGQAAIDTYIAHIQKMTGKPIDAVIFDNIMSLIGGDMKDGEGWRQTLPWIHSLTARSIGQLWLHHTGHDENKSYGDKTKEWQLDTTLFFEDASTDKVAAKLVFRKARERIPQNWKEFEPLDFALVDGVWSYTGGGPAIRKRDISPKAQKFLDAFHNVTSTHNWDGKQCISIADWMNECAIQNLLPKDDGTRDCKKKSSTHLSKYKIELIAANRIACNNDRAWLI